jgi:hypothetical protein
MDNILNKADYPLCRVQRVHGGLRDIGDFLAQDIQPHIVRLHARYISAVYDNIAADIV